MDYEPLVRALTHLAWDAPTLVVCAAGVVASRVYRRQFPRPCRFILLGCGMLLGAYALSTLANVYQYRAFVTQKDTTLGGWLLPTMSMMSSVGRGLGIGLLVAAATIFRSESRDATVPNAPSALMLPVFRAWIAIASLSLYLVSLFLPAVYVSAPAIDGSNVYRGYQCLLEIPLALMYPAWWANPLFAIGIVLVLRRNLILAGLCGCVSLLFSLSYCLSVWQDFRFNQPLRIGYWFWVAAMLVLAASVIPPFVCRRADNGNGQTPSPG